MTIAGLILAAGLSRRMGTAKLALSVDGVPMLRRVAETALAARLSPVLAVTGPEATLDPLLPGGVILTRNPAPERGLASSLSIGLAALPEADGALVMLADMPLVKPETIAALIAAHGPGIDACVPYHDGKRGNPVLLGRALFTAARTLAGDKGAAGLLEGERIRAVPVDDPGVLIDFDRPHDLIRR